MDTLSLSTAASVTKEEALAGDGCAGRTRDRCPPAPQPFEGCPVQAGALGHLGVPSLHSFPAAANLAAQPQPCRLRQGLMAGTRVPLTVWRAHLKL